MDQNAVIAGLQTLTDKRIVELFYEAVKGRRTSDIKEWRGHLVLADWQKVENEHWEVQFVALADKSAYDGPWADDAPISQSGECIECANSVCSWAKHAICPVCGNGVNCT